MNKLQKQHRRCQIVEGGRREEDHAIEHDAQLEDKLEAHRHLREAV